MLVGDQSRAFAQLLLLVYGAIGVLAVFFLLSHVTRFGQLSDGLLTAGSAGAAATSLATLRRYRVPGEAPDNGAGVRSVSLLIVSTATPAVAGFAAGAFSLLVALVLLAGGRPALPASAAVFGGLFGLLLAKSAQSLVAPAQIFSGMTAALGGAGFQRDLQSVRYRGRVATQLKVNGESGMVAAVLSLRFTPDTRGRRGRFQSLARRLIFGVYKQQRRTEDALVQDGRRRNFQSGQVWTDAGEFATEAEFVITVVPVRGFEALPKSKIVAVPTRDVSTVYEFTMVRRFDSEHLSADEASYSSSPRLTSQLGSPSAVVEVAQRGRTLCLMQVSPEPRPMHTSSADSGDPDEQEGTDEANPGWF